MIVESDFFFLFFFSFFFFPFGTRLKAEAKRPAYVSTQCVLRVCVRERAAPCRVNTIQCDAMRCDAMRCDEPGTGTGTAGFFPDRKKKK